MGIRRRLFLSTAAMSFVTTTAIAQETPPLGDIARQQRQQKSQPKATPDKTLKPVKIITNEEIPERPEMAAPRRNGTREVTQANYPATESKFPPEHWKSQILAQKNQIASLEGQVNQINESIRFAPANCVANCVGWNERQREKQQQVERMQAQLEDQKRRLEEMQDSARKQGYGSSVYDP
jgi:hypothetical protein